MCWTTHERRLGQTEADKLATKKDEGEAFRSGKTGDTPKPLREEAPKNREMVDAK